MFNTPPDCKMCCVCVCVCVLDPSYVCLEGEVTLYHYGWKDSATILFYFFIAIILHAVVQEYLLDVSTQSLRRHAPVTQRGPSVLQIYCRSESDVCTQHVVAVLSATYTDYFQQT